MFSSGSEKKFQSTRTQTHKQRRVKLHVSSSLFTNMIQTDKESVETHHLALAVTVPSLYWHHGFYGFMGKHERLNFACAWLHIHAVRVDRNNRHNSSAKELHQHWHHRGNVWNLFSALTQSSSGSIYWVNSSWGEKLKEKRKKKWKMSVTVLWKSTKRNTCREIAAKMHQSVGKSHIIWSFRHWETKYYPKREWSRFNVTGWGMGGETRERKDQQTKKLIFTVLKSPKQQTWGDLSFPLTFFKMYFMSTHWRVKPLSIWQKYIMWLTLTWSSESIVTVTPYRYSLLFKTMFFWRRKRN